MEKNYDSLIMGLADAIDDLTKQHLYFDEKQQRHDCEEIHARIHDLVNAITALPAADKQTAVIQTQLLSSVEDLDRQERLQQSIFGVLCRKVMPFNLNYFFIPKDPMRYFARGEA